MYLLNYEASPKFKYAYKDVSFSGFENTVCPSCQRTVAVMRYDEPVHKFVVEGGKCYPDLLQFCGAGERTILLSEYAIRVLTENEISGMGKRELVVLLSPDGKPAADAPQYYCVDVQGWIDLDYKAMHLKKKKLCLSCGQFEWNRQRLDPILLDEASWNGNDLCRVKSIPGFCACSTRFLQVVKESRLTGFVFP